MRLRSILGLMAAMGLLVSSAFAAPVAVPNHSFQLPARDGDGNIVDEDAFDVANAFDPPSGWSFVNTANDNYGQQRPHPVNHFTRDTTGGELAPFSLGGFDGDLILFANMNTVDASLTADSDVIGQLKPGDYTLTVALGARNTGSWNDLNYEIGLVGSVSGALGTATAVTLNPGNADMNSVPGNSWTTDAYNVTDVTYSLNVPVGSSLVDEDYFIRIFAENSGFHDGVADTDFAQAAIDNVRLSYIPEPSTGVMLGIALLMGVFGQRKRRA